MAQRDSAAITIDARRINTELFLPCQYDRSEGFIDFKGIDLIQQDEYSYDLYLPLVDSRWLIFGVS